MLLDGHCKMDMVKISEFHKICGPMTWFEEVLQLSYI